MLPLTTRKFSGTIANHHFGERWQKNLLEEPLMNRRQMAKRVGGISLGITALSTLVVALAYCTGFAYGIGQRHGLQSVTKPMVAISMDQNFVNTLSPQDAAIWKANAWRAQVCDNCSGLAEFAPEANQYPLMVQVRDTLTSSVAYTMVVGVVYEHPRRPIVTPVLRYYVGHQSGAGLRIDERGQYYMRIRDHWVRKNDIERLEAADQPRLKEIRSVFDEASTSRLR